MVENDKGKDAIFIEVTNEGASQSRNLQDNEDENPYSLKKIKHTSKVWTKFKVLLLLDKFQKVKCIHYKHNLTILKGGTTI